MQGTELKTNTGFAGSGAFAAAVGVISLWYSEPSAAGTVQISIDPFTNASSQHMTEVEPQIFSDGSTLVAVFQQGRFLSGGASDIGFATSNERGITWQTGPLPGLTVWSGGDRYESVSDPSLAYNAAFGLWEVVSLPVGYGTREIFISRSADGITWDNPITAVSASSGSFDKTWMTCDNWRTSPFFGNCYIEWDDVDDGGAILMSTSTDGGATWGLPLNTADHATGLGGQPLVQPSGRVVVPYMGIGSIRSFISDDGGSSWRASTYVASEGLHVVQQEIRAPDVPSAAIDGNGTIYVVWFDGRFRSSSNDIVMTTSADGETWSDVTRIPIDDVGSNADFFLPGIGADRNSYPPNVGLAIVYYYYPDFHCSYFSCQLIAGFVTSPDGGASWSEPIDLTGPMSLDWLASTNQGRMVGDYFSVFYTDDGTPYPVFAVATPRMPGMLFESMFSTCPDCPSAPAPRPKADRCHGHDCPLIGGVEPVAKEWTPASAASPSGALRINADAYRVNIGTRLPLSASGPAAWNRAVQWSVEEGERGGTVSDSGLYVAGKSPGTYHVVASSGGERARLTIEVFTVR